MDIRLIVSESGMSSRPGFYSGRGATMSDLNSKILNKIADLIKKHYGEDAHQAFIKMVWEIKILSASAFLVNLYALERAGWKLSKITITNKDSYFENEGEAMGLLLATLTRKDTDSTGDTDTIRNGFRKK